MLLIVEGAVDVKALTHSLDLYKAHGLINKSFAEMGVVLVPAGGVPNMKHWLTLKVAKSLRKPFFIIVDSDKTSISDLCAHESMLVENGLTEGIDFHILKKRSIENYINPAYFSRAHPEVDISYGDFDNLKEICKRHTDVHKLKGGSVADWHFCLQTIDEITASMAHEYGDELLDIITILNTKLEVSTTTHDLA